MKLNCMESFSCCKRIPSFNRKSGGSDIKRRSWILRAPHVWEKVCINFTTMSPELVNCEAVKVKRFYYVEVENLVRSSEERRGVGVCQEFRKMPSFG